MSKQQEIEDKLTATYRPVFMKVLNESQFHKMPGNDTHFNVTLVTDRFSGLSAVARHRDIFKTLEKERSGIHALSIHPFTADEWRKKGGGIVKSPTCVGKNNAAPGEREQ